MKVRDGNKRLGRMRYAVVIEKGETSYGAYVPDLSGCIAVGETREEVERLMDEAFEFQFHLECMKLAGLPIPEPTSDVITMEVAAPFAAD